MQLLDQFFRHAVCGILAHVAFGLPDQGRLLFRAIADGLLQVLQDLVGTRAEGFGRGGRRRRRALG